MRRISVMAAITWAVLAVGLATAETVTVPLELGGQRYTVSITPATAPAAEPVVKAEPAAKASPAKPAKPAKPKAAKPAATPKAPQTPVAPAKPVSPATSPAVAPVVPLSRPTLDTVGPVPGALMTKSGSIVAKAGQVIENRIVSGSIDARAGGVTIRNCVINADGKLYGVQANGAPARVTIENCEIYNATSKGIYGDNLTARGNYLRDLGADGAQLGDGSTFEGNLVRRIGKSAGSHADGVQIRGGRNIAVRGNAFEQNPADGFNANSAIFLQGAGERPCQDVRIENNYIAGDWNFAIRPRSDGGDARTIVVRGNVIDTSALKFGWLSAEAGVVVEHNIDHHGKPLGSK